MSVRTFETFETQSGSGETVISKGVESSERTTIERCLKFENCDDYTYN